MLPNPSLGTTAEPLLEVLDDLVPAELHSAAWARCSGKGWYFGHGSKQGDGSRFWKMDLDADQAFDAIWELARPRCEALAGTPLRVLRQYANGHTYGLGGRPHQDDGAFTLLYYPNPEWRDGWDGETVFYDPSGEISFAIRPRPNRCVFFDTRILHAGRPPSRGCPALRVTVAYKLARGHSAPSARPVEQDAVDPVQKLAPESDEAIRIGSAGATHVYSIRIPAEQVDRAVQERLENLSRTVRLPGFRPGHIPDAVLKERYGAQARSHALNRLAAEAMDRALPKGSIASAIERKGGAQSGDLEMRVSATHLPDLPPVDFSEVTLERLTAEDATLQAAGVTPEAATAMFRDHLKAQVLDRLDSAYRFPVLPSLVEREFAVIWKAAQSEAEIPADAQAQASSQLRAIAERRLRLGLVVTEMARRFEIRSGQGSELEDQVIDRLLAQAPVQEHALTEQELREMLKA
jgi:hypothetical protein